MYTINPVPPDAEEVFRTVVPDDVRPRNWFGKNVSGRIYRFSVDNNNMAHFSGIDGVGDGIRNVTPYARKRLAQLP